MAQRWLIGISLVVAACSSSAPSTDSARSEPTATEASGDTASIPVSTSPSTEPTATTVASEAAAALDAFAAHVDPAANDFQAIHELVADRPGEVEEAALERLGTTDPMMRWVAVYTLALTADDEASMAALVPILSSPDIGERMLAAGGLIWNGDKSAFPALIDALGSDDSLPFRPPQRAWQFARYVLVEYTAQDMGLLGPHTYSFEQAAAARPAWERWWADHGAALRFDPTERVFR